jgi:hypothetical protein
MGIWKLINIYILFTPSVAKNSLLEPRAYAGAYDIHSRGAWSLPEGCRQLSWLLATPSLRCLANRIRRVLQRLRSVA